MWLNCEVAQEVARWAHNPEAVRSSRTLAKPLLGVILLLIGSDTAKCILYSNQSKNTMRMYTKDTAKETYLPERSKGCDLRSPG
jgi:hypothetical protein